MRKLVLIGCIGFSILLIACFNFINLTIALNTRRYKDAGIRKVVGAHKSTIILQHLGESVLLILISFLTATDLARVVINSLNRAFHGNVQFNFGDPEIILAFAGIAVFTLIASGLLPALYISSSKPVNILRGEMLTSHSFSFFRQSLIVSQFTIPVVLIIFVLIIKIQDSYFRNYDLGFDKDRLLIIAGSEKAERHSESIRADLLSIPDIESVSFSKWLIIASVISIPAAYILGNVFLSRFNFRASMPFWLFIAGPAIAYVVALSAVIFQSRRAAVKNPVEALRYE